MVRTRDPFSTALDSLRGRLAAGAFGAGDPIVIQDEARRLRLSTTPVREALAWLAGAGLVEHMPSGGYIASRLDASIAHALYRLRNIYLQSSLTTGDHRTAGYTPPNLPLAFQWLVARSGDTVLTDAFLRVEMRLSQLVGAEASVLKNGSALESEIMAAVSAGQIAGLGDLISTYHQERMEAAAALAFEAALSRLGRASSG